MDEGRRRLQQLLDSGAFNGGACPSGSGGGCAGDNRSSAGAGNGSSAGATSGPSSGAAGGDCGDAAPSGTAGGSSSAGNGDCSGTAVPWDALFQLLSDDRRLEEDPARLPDTGYGHEFEAAVSGIFVQVRGLLAAAAGGAHTVAACRVHTVASHRRLAACLDLSSSSSSALSSCR